MNMRQVHCDAHGPHGALGLLHTDHAPCSQAATLHSPPEFAKRAWTAGSRFTLKEAEELGPQEKV